MTTIRRLMPDDPSLTSLIPADGCHLAEQQSMLAEHGYVWLRGLIPVDRCRAATAAIASRLAGLGVLDPDRPEITLPWNAGQPPAPGFQETRDRQPEVASAVQATEVEAAITALLGGPATSSTYLWTRPVGPGSATGVHIDHVYMGLGSPRILTTWCCLDAVPRRLGGLVVMPGSHRAPALQRVHATYGASDVDRDLMEGTFDDSPVDFRERYGTGWDGRWATADYGVGDVVIFGKNMVHASMVNTTDRYRLTCDARWTPDGEPMDPRWFGPAPLGHHRWKNGAAITRMAAARASWGV